jgi:GMP synthase (glutamine-hydrolysing)
VSTASLTGEVGEVPMGNTALLLQHAPEERGGLFESLLLEKEWELEICPLFSGTPLPSSFKEYGLILIPSGPMRSTDIRPSLFLKKEIAFIRQALKVDHPVLGIGLGAELMATALGAKVSRGPHKEIGWYWINQTPQARSDPLFSQLDPFLLAFQWHEEAFALPPEAVCLAGNRAYPNQAFRFEYHSYGLQFHLEVTEAMIKAWLSSWVQEIQMTPFHMGTPEDILNDSHIYSERIHRQARIFFLGYLDLIEKNIEKKGHSFFSTNKGSRVNVKAREYHAK